MLLKFNLESSKTIRLGWVYLIMGILVALLAMYTVIIQPYEHTGF